MSLRHLGFDPFRRGAIHTTLSPPVAPPQHRLYFFPEPLGRDRCAQVRVRTSIRIQVLCHKDFIVVAAVLLEGLLFESIFHKAQTLI